MSIKIEINKNQINKDEKLKLHFLPAKVNGNGTANVDNYFNNYTRIENGMLTNAFRGYPLQGTEYNVPDNFKAVVLQESENSKETEERILRVSGTFEKFTYWNYDKMPSKADVYIQAMQWYNLAEDLLKPVNEADVLAEINLSNNETACKENKT